MTAKDYGQMVRSALYQLRGNGLKSMKAQMSVFEALDNTLMPDLYGTGDVIDDFEKLLSSEFGKSAAVFFPSGTMAQQIALRIHCDHKAY